MTNVIPKEDPFVTIVIPCRNEARFIKICLESIITCTYPKNRLEILLVDGISEDGTREIVNTYAERYKYLRVLKNSKKQTPAALNIGITQARGEIIIRLDAHARYERDYITKCVRCLKETGADNVGGCMRTIPQRESFLGYAIAFSLSHPFGVGNSYFRIHTDKPMLVDTVFGGCYRKDVFEKVGLFNENLARGQDIDFNLRLKKAGGNILLMPHIVSHYYARSDMKSFVRHNWGNGVWAILPFSFSKVIPVSWRHLVPLLFVTSLIIPATLTIVEKSFIWLFLIIVVSYGIANFAASMHVAWREKNVKYLFLMPLIFGVLHVMYGLGSLWGVGRLFIQPEFWQKTFGWEKKYGAGKG